MTADANGEERTLSIRLEAQTFAALEQTAAERGQPAGELVARWVRERLAHEAERRLGRERPQRPGA
jgi:predicted DNA-binding ribbon-helix-helix protein